MYNLLEYSDNFAESSGSLWQYKRDEQNMTNTGNPDNVNTNIHHHLNTSQIFKRINY